MNIRGHECFNCTAPLWYGKAEIFLHTDSDTNICELNVKTIAVYSETTLVVVTLLIHYTDVRLDLTTLLNFGWMASETMPSLLFSVPLDDRA